MEAVEIEWRWLRRVGEKTGEEGGVYFGFP